MGSKRHIESLTRPHWLHKLERRGNSWYLRRPQGPGFEKPCLCCEEGRQNVPVYAMPRCHAFRLRPRPHCVVRNPHHKALAFPSQVQTQERYTVQHHQMSVTHVSGFSLPSHNVVPDPVYDEGLTIILSSLLCHLFLQPVWELSHLSPLTCLPPCYPLRPILYI